MSTPTPSNERNEPPHRKGRGDNATAITISVIRFFTTLVDRFGWPGAALIAGATAIQLWATLDQKHQIIDMFILGKGMHSWWPLAVPSAVFVLLVWAQRETNKREVKRIKEEMRRVGAQKSALQEELARRRLRHGQPDE
jgi:hypothetical protein